MIETKKTEPITAESMKTFEELCKAWNEANADAKAKVKAAVYARNREDAAFDALKEFLQRQHREVWKDRIR